MFPYHVGKWREPRHAVRYDGFKIEPFEAGRGLWHARIRRRSGAVIIDGVSFPALEVGFAWSDPDTAIRMRNANRISSSLSDTRPPGQMQQPEQ